MDGTYITIPGFSRYRIHTVTREVQSKALTKQWKSIKPHRNGLIRIISDDKTVEYSGAPARILYAAQRGINPAKISKHLYVVEINGELTLLDRKALQERKGKKKPRSVETAKREYHKAIEFCQMVLRAYDTNDYSEVVREIWQQHDEVTAYIRAKRICLTNEGINEMWMQVFDSAIDHIRNNHTFICNLPAYLRKVVRSLHSQKLKIDRIIKSYDNKELNISRNI